MEGEGARFPGAIQGMEGGIQMVAGLALFIKQQDPIISDSRAMTAQLVNTRSERSSGSPQNQAGSNVMSD